MTPSWPFSQVSKGISIITRREINSDVWLAGAELAANKIKLKRVSNHPNSAFQTCIHAAGRNLGAQEREIGVILWPY
jgi:hypothetical protein